MRKRSAYRPRPLTPPMLVNRGLINDDLELKERQIIQAFASGWATTRHYDELADMRNVLTLAAAYKDDSDVLAICEAMRILMGNIRIRHAQTGRMGVSGDEMKLLQVFVDVYRDFWIRQPVKLYEMACDELNRAHEMGLCPGNASFSGAGTASAASDSCTSAVATEQ